MTIKKRIIIITISFLCASFVWANPFDINQDNKTGLPEAIHALKVSAGINDGIQCNQYSLNAVDGDPQNAVYVDSVGKAIFSNKVVIKTYIVTLTDTETDLGEQLQSLLDKYQYVKVYLPENTTWNWDTYVFIENDHSLQIRGAGTIDVHSISTTINMQKRSYKEIGGMKNRAPMRALLRNNALLFITNVHIVEAINDDTTIHRQGYGSLFNIYDTADGARIEIVYSKAWTTENLCGFGGGRGYGRIVFGHTYHYMHSSCTVRDHVYTVFTDNGWMFDGQGGVVSNSFVTQGPGVLFQRSPKIKYLYGGSISEEPGGDAYIDSTLHVQGNIVSEGDICIGKCF
jgi:hypothetical protein